MAVLSQKQTASCDCINNKSNRWRRTIVKKDLLARGTYSQRGLPKERQHLKHLQRANGPVPLEPTHHVSCNLHRKKSRYNIVLFGLYISPAHVQGSRSGQKLKRTFSRIHLHCSCMFQQQEKSCTHVVSLVRVSRRRTRPLFLPFFSSISVSHSLLPHSQFLVPNQKKNIEIICNNGRMMVLFNSC